MSFSEHRIPLWRKLAVTCVVVLWLVCTYLGLGVWELGRCSEEYAGYCRERSFVDVIVIGFILIGGTGLVVTLIKFLTRDPS